MKQTKPRLVTDADTPAATPGTESAPAAGPAAINVEITEFTKASGALTKRISLVNNKVVSDGSECRMAHGKAHSVRVSGAVYAVMKAIADRMNGFAACQALALGRRKHSSQEIVEVVTKRELPNAPGAIARSQEFLEFPKGEPGLFLFDLDTKGQPDEVRRRVEGNGGPWLTLTKVLTKLEDAARIERKSTSSCLRNTETGDEFEGSGGRHIYGLARDGADIPRFIRDAHARLWLAGYGYGMVSKAGSFLPRSLIDASVGTPERLVFEAPPIVEAPLKQDLEARKAIVCAGATVDTWTCAPPLSLTEKKKLKELVDAERESLKPEMAKARELWIAEQVKKLIDKGTPEDEARARVERMLDEKELTGAFELVFADPALGSVTVADVLADPDKYVDQNLADPFEGVEYGRTTAILRRRRDGSLWISSFAHGGIRYDLKEEGAAILPRGYTQDAKGIWYTPPGDDNDNPRRTCVCGPLHVIAQTRDDAANNHGLLLRWADPDGVEHTWAMPRELVHADGNQIARELERAGLSCGTSNKAHELLKQLLGGVRIVRRMRCVARTGWHGSTLVLPGGDVIGPGRDDVVLQREHVAVGEKYAARGSLPEWQERVSGFAVGNDLMVLHVSASFAAPLLDILHETSGGFNIPGGSRLGKTTLLRCGKSVWGPGDDKHLGTWRATANGLEAIAAETNDLPLFLDELKQADPRQAGEIIYMLGSSSGKRRANRAAGAKNVATWNTLFMSSGEQTLEQKLAETGMRPFAGMAVRMIEIEADASVGLYGRSCTASNRPRHSPSIWAGPPLNIAARPGRPSLSA
jgi:hypothetical protein